MPWHIVNIIGNRGVSETIAAEGDVCPVCEIMSDGD